MTTPPRTGAIAFKPEYLGFAALVATLPIYEPALHSFHTIAPQAFDATVLPYSQAALTGALVTAAVLVALGLKRRAPQAGSIEVGEKTRETAGEKGADGPWVPPLTWRAVMAACAVAGAVGLCLLAGPGLPLPLGVALGAAGGVGSALLLVSWGRIFCTGDARTVLAHLAGAGVLGAFLMNGVGTLPYPLACGIFGCLELVALALAWVAPGAGGETLVPAAMRTAMPGAPGSASAPRAQAAAARGAALEPLGGIALFGLAFPLLGNHTVPFFYLSFLVGSIVAGIAVAPVVLARTRRPSTTLLQNAVLPLAGFAAVAFSVASPQSALARGAFMVFFSFAIILLLGELVERARSDDRGAAVVFSAAVGAYALAALVGSGLSMALDAGACSTAFTVLTLLYLACIAVRPTLVGWRTGATATACIGGGTVLGPASAAAAIALEPERLAELAERYRLTEREAEILRLVAGGATSGEIAEALVISNSTARGHAHKIYQKLGVSTREELLEFLADAEGAETVGAR